MRKSAFTAARLAAQCFHDHALRDDKYLLGIARYIIANPLHVGLAKNRRISPLGCDMDAVGGQLRGDCFTKKLPHKSGAYQNHPLGSAY